MRRFLRFVLDRLPYIGNLRKQVKDLRQQVRNQGGYRAGHYYSPIPNRDDVLEYIKCHEQNSLGLSDVNLNKEGQFELLQEYQEFYESLPFPEHKEQNYRYYYDQIWYGYSDAIFLYSFLRKNKPKRIIEVGSGFSSAVILDTVERFYNHKAEITFIEPNPVRLHSILRPQDKDNVQIYIKKVQDVSIEVFKSLESGDFLFIDSSHVVKCGSDVQFLMFEVIPHLSPGVFVHFHDIFFPFEYPSEWLANGTYWNEDYILRAFLAYNNQWRIYFFNNFATVAFRDFLEEKMPLCLKNAGGSIYIQKMSEG